MKKKVVFGLVFWSGLVLAAEDSKQPVAPPNSPTELLAASVKRMCLTRENSLDQASGSTFFENGTLPLLPSPTILHKDKDGKLILLPSPRLYYKDEKGNLIPVDQLFDESDFDESDSEDLEMIFKGETPQPN